MSVRRSSMYCAESKEKAAATGLARHAEVGEAC